MERNCWYRTADDRPYVRGILLAILPSMDGPVAIVGGHPRPAGIFEVPIRHVRLSQPLPPEFGPPEPEPEPAAIA